MFGGIGPAARALTGYVVGLISPLTLLAAGVATLAVAYYKGSQEQDEFRRSLSMTGNAAGTSVAAMTEMARSLQGKGFTQSGAAATLAEMAATGQVAASNLENFTGVALSLDRVGIPIKNTVKDLEELGKSPLEASIKLTNQYRYLQWPLWPRSRLIKMKGARPMLQRSLSRPMSARWHREHQRWKGIWASLSGLGSRSVARLRLFGTRFLGLAERGRLPMSWLE